MRSALKAATFAAVCCAANLAGSPAAHAQTVTALQDTTCAGFRAGSQLGCTAGEFTVGATFSGATGTPAFCTAGQMFIFDASLTLSGSNTERYDIGFFVGQQGNSPTAATAGNICSVAVFPTSPAPWGNYDGDDDACGDFLGGGAANPLVNEVKVVCAALPGETDLTIPYVVTYDQGTKTTCSTAANVQNGSKSKCNTGSAKLEVSEMPVQVGGYVDVTKQTSPDGSTQPFTYTATGPVGSAVGIEMNGVSTNNFADDDPNIPSTLDNNNTITFTLRDGETARVYMSVLPGSNRTLTVTEELGGQVTHWEGSASIQCNASEGSPTFTSDNATRQITASLNTVDKGVACTITNTKRARVSLVEQVDGRLYPADQFQLAVSGAGSSTLTSATGTAIAANQVTVTTSGTSTGAFTNATYPEFRATPGQPLTLATTMAPGSTSPASRYATTLTCTNAFTGPGATTALPTNQAVSSFVLTPAPDDDITCTYRHAPLALLTLSKVVVNDDGLTRTAADWTLSAAGPTNISGKTGTAAVTSATVQPGTYTLSESGPSGYTMTGLSCSGGADGDPSGGLAIAAGEIVSCAFTNDDTQVGQALVKSDAQQQLDPDGSGTITEGDTLAYTITLTNTGITTLTTVLVSDPQLSPGSQACASVPTGGTCVLTGTRVVTASDVAAGEIVNTASVTSDQVTTPTSSNTVTTPVLERPAPALEVVKSHSGTFSAGGMGVYTIQVGNVGYGTISGTTTVTDTLDPDLQFVSATGTGWTCGAAGTPQVVTCTSSADIGGFDEMAPITLTVAIDGDIGSSVDNMATVANGTIDGGTPVDGNIDTATVVHPDLSTSTKTVVNLGGGSSAVDVDAGDVLQYTINLVESAGAEATGVRVTDTVQADLGSVAVTMLPAGATDDTAGNVVDINDITVPANGTVQVRFTAVVGAGLAPGDPINNTATVDNPGGADATPVAPTLFHEQSQVISDEDKILYVHSGGILNRTPHAGIDTTGTTVNSSADWDLVPALARQLVLTAGTINVNLSMQTGASMDVTVALFDGITPIGSASAPQTVDLDTPAVIPFQIDLASDYTVASGGTLTLRVTKTGNKSLTIFDYNVDASTISFHTSTPVHVDSVEAYTTAYGSGNTVADYFVAGDTAYVRVAASDPFGGADVSTSDSMITITDANGAVVAGPVQMSGVAVSGATRTLEYAVPLPADAPLGVWTATATAYEGTEHTINHTSSGTFEIRGKVNLDLAWGAGASAPDAVLLQVVGGSDAVDGSATAPDPASLASAVAAGGAAITLVQSFTSGDPGTYGITLACVRDADGAALPVTGTGLSRQITMPLDSSVTCTWTDTKTVPLTLVKLMLVHSDPVNGLVNPKAIPGAIVEYRIIVTNPGSPVDGDTVVVSDSLPDLIEFRVADISGAGSGSGPVRFTDSTTSPSGLTFAYPADIAFSSTNGASWDYVPSDPDGDGIDPNITDIRINPKGTFNGSGGQFTLSFRARVE